MATSQTEISLEADQHLSLVLSPPPPLPLPSSPPPSNPACLPPSYPTSPQYCSRQHRPGAYQLVCDAQQSAAEQIRARRAVWRASRVKRISPEKRPANEAHRTNRQTQHLPLHPPRHPRHFFPSCSVHSRPVCGVCTRVTGIQSRELRRGVISRSSRKHDWQLHFCPLYMPCIEQCPTNQPANQPSCPRMAVAVLDTGVQWLSVPAVCALWVVRRGLKRCAEQSTSEAYGRG